MITINGEPINITKFPDGTSQVWKLAAHPEPVEVNWRFEGEAEVMHLAQLARLLAAYCERRHLTIQYLPYARQDKYVSNDQTFALRAFAPILNGMDWSSVTIYDPHSEEATKLIQRSKARYHVAKTLYYMGVAAADLLCFPDDGAARKYGSLFEGVAFVRAEKERDQLSGRVVTGRIVGDVRDKRVMIVDDICDGGATFIGLAGELYEEGAADVTLFVSHGLFTKGVKVLTDARISRVFTPNGEVFP